MPAAAPAAPSKAVATVAPMPVNQAKTSGKRATPSAPAPAPARPATAAAKPVRSTKDKLVRDSFTMPRADFALIQQLKDRALGFKRATKKSELLRAGLQALAALSAGQLQAQLGKLATIKAGRPKKAV